MGTTMLAHLLALAAATTIQPPQPYDAHDEAAARAWIAKVGHRFDPAAPLPADREPLVDRLKGAKVIGIGEVTHGTHNDQAFKAELIKALVRAGAVDMLAIECNRAAGAGFDRYVIAGDGDPAALLRSPSFFATWRDDEFAGLLVWLRAWNQVAAAPIHMVGIDNQDAGVDAALALALVRRHDPATADRLARQLGTMLGEPGGRPPRYADWAMSSDASRYLPAQDAAGSLRALLADPPADWRTDPDLPDAREAAERAWEGLKIFERDYKGATPPSDTDMEYAARRDGFMAQSLTRVAGAAHVALWAHDLHVMWSPWGKSAGAANLGTFLRRTYGDGYRSVGFSWSSAAASVRHEVSPSATSACLPAIVDRNTHVRVPAAVTRKYRPPPSARRPGFFAASAARAVS